MAKNCKNRQNCEKMHKIVQKSCVQTPNNLHRWKKKVALTASPMSPSFASLTASSNEAEKAWRNADYCPGGGAFTKHYWMCQLQPLGRSKPKLRFLDFNYLYSFEIDNQLFFRLPMSKWALDQSYNFWVGHFHCIVFLSIQTLS